MCKICKTAGINPCPTVVCSICCRERIYPFRKVGLRNPPVIASQCHPPLGKGGYVGQGLAPAAVSRLRGRHKCLPYNQIGRHNVGTDILGGPPKAGVRDVVGAVPYKTQIHLTVGQRLLLPTCILALKNQCFCQIYIFLVKSQHLWYNIFGIYKILF